MTSSSETPTPALNTIGIYEIYSGKESRSNLAKKTKDGYIECFGQPVHIRGTTNFRDANRFAEYKADNIPKLPQGIDSLVKVDTDKISTPKILIWFFVLNPTKALEIQELELEAGREVISLLKSQCKKYIKNNWGGKLSENFDSADDKWPSFEVFDFIGNKKTYSDFIEKQYDFFDYDYFTTHTEYYETIYRQCYYHLCCIENNWLFVRQAENSTHITKTIFHNSNFESVLILYLLTTLTSSGIREICEIQSKYISTKLATLDKLDKRFMKFQIFYVPLYLSISQLLNQKTEIIKHSWGFKHCDKKDPETLLLQQIFERLEVESKLIYSYEHNIAKIANNFHSRAVAESNFALQDSIKKLTEYVLFITLLAIAITSFSSENKIFEQTGYWGIVFIAIWFAGLYVPRLYKWITKKLSA